MTSSSVNPAPESCQDLIGKTVLGMQVKAFAFTRNSQHLLRCICYCGELRFISESRLRLDMPLSCHCHRKKTWQERFWAKVEKLPGEDGCWEWKGCVSKSGKLHGYGGFQYNGKRVWTHRFSYEMHVGPIPPGMCVCHKCDNRKCLRPDHLFLGTKKDNAMDMVKKGRHGHAKVKPHIAKDIYDRYHSGRNTVTELAEEYQLNTGTVDEIIYGKTWRHATGAPPWNGKRGKKLRRTVRLGDTRYVVRVLGDFFGDTRMPNAHPVAGKPEQCEIVLHVGLSTAWLRMNREQAKSLSQQLQTFLAGEHEVVERED